MIIGIDASRANTDHRTGTEWYSFFIIKELLIQDNNNNYILYIKSPLVEDMKFLTEYAEIKTLNWPPKFLWSLFRLSWEMLLHKPDKLFVPAHTLPIIKPNKIITTCHDIGFERYPELYASKPIGPKNKLLLLLINFFTRLLTLGKYRNTELDYHKFSMKFALKHADKIITVSNFTKKELIDVYSVEAGKVEVIYPGINPEYLLNITPQESTRILINNHIIKPFFIFVGRLEKKKNIDLILKSFDIVKQRGFSHKLVLIGRSGWGFSKSWSELPDKTKKDILILNIWTKLPQIMSQAEALVFPSAYEGFGLPVIEAMACGIPVIISNQASLPEIASKAAFIIDSPSKESLADGMIEIISNEELKKQLISKGLEHYKKYTWSEAGRKTLKLINNI